MGRPLRMRTGLASANGVRCAGYTNDSMPSGTPAVGKKGHCQFMGERVVSAVWDAFGSLLTSKVFVEWLLLQTPESNEQILVAQELEFLREKLGMTIWPQVRSVDVGFDRRISSEASRILKTKQRARMRSSKHSWKWNGLGLQSPVTDRPSRL